MPDWIQLPEPLAIGITFAVSALHVSCAIAVTLHSILRQRQNKATMAWIGLAWLAPLWGSLAYLVLGVNRIERKGAALDFEEARRKVASPQLGPAEQEHVARFIHEHPSLEGLAHLGRQVTSRSVLLGNRVKPLVNGDEAYPEMLEAIGDARGSVALLSYIFDSDRAGEQFLEALADATGRGLEVRVLIDHVGSRYSKPSMAERLREAGVRVATFLPTARVGMFRYANLRNHRKILVADGKIGFTGGTNIREGHCLDLDPAAPVQCLHFRIDGPVVSHLMETFATDWAFATGERLEADIWFRPVAHVGHVGARGISDGPDGDIDKMNQVILGAIAAATRSVRIVTPYFLPDEVILWALAVAAMRHVRVDIVVPSRNNIRVMDWAVVPQWPFLLEKGCHVYQTPEPFDHTKLMVVDGSWSLIGSTNWDARSLRLNFEFNIECYDRALAANLEEHIDAKIANAHPVSAEEIANRSAPVRLRDGLTRLLSPYL